MTIYKNHFYVYAYLREDFTPYYIGKGNGRRALSKNRAIPKPKDPSRIVLLHEDLDEETAFDLETSLVYHYGRQNIGTGILWNLTDGGEGTSGWMHSEESKEKIRQSKIGEKNPSYGKPGTMTGVKFSSQSKEKMRIAKLGKPPWNKGREGPPSPFKDKKHSEESKEKMRNAKLGRKHSEETRKKMRIAKLGRKHSEESKQLMSAAQKKRRAENSIAISVE